VYGEVEKNKHDKSGRATAAHKFWPNTPRLPKGAIRGSYVVDNSHNMIPAPDNILPQLWGPNTYAKHKTIVYSGWCYHHFATEQVLRETVKNYAVIPPLSQDCNEFRGGLDNLDSAFFFAHTSRRLFETSQSLDVWTGLAQEVLQKFNPAF